MKISLSFLVAIATLYSSVVLAATTTTHQDHNDHRLLQETTLDSLIPADVDPSSLAPNLVREQKGLTGTIPTTIGLLTDTQVIDVSLNELDGTIPTQIGLLGALKILNLRGNKLVGPIPTQIGLLTSLMQLGLDDNALDGDLPTEIANLSNLRTFKVGGTNQIIGGTLPFAWLESSGFYTDWIASYLEMVGSIPTQIGLCTTLKVLELFVENIKGTLPTEIGNLDLESLHLEYNEMGGKIPSQLGLMSNLEWLSFHDNKFTGTIPTTLGNAIKLTSLQLDTNDLTGPLPTEIGKLVQLQTLNLNDNAGLTGELPGEELAAIARRGMLREMNVTRTRLGGTIPQDVCLITYECQEECYFEYDCDTTGDGLCGCSGCNCPIEVLEPGTYESGRFEDDKGLLNGEESSAVVVFWRSNSFFSYMVMANIMACVVFL